MRRSSSETIRVFLARKSSTPFFLQLLKREITLLFFVGKASLKSKWFLISINFPWICKFLIPTLDIHFTVYQKIIRSRCTIHSQAKHLSFFYAVSTPEAISTSSIYLSIRRQLRIFGSIRSSHCFTDLITHQIRWHPLFGIKSPVWSLSIVLPPKSQKISILPRKTPPNEI